MSLKRNNENEPTVTSQEVISEKTGLPIEQPQTEPEQRIAYFSREKLHREQQRIEKQYRQKKARQAQEMYQEQEDEEMPETAQNLPQGLDQIKAAINRLAIESGANTEEAKKDERVLVMASAVLEMCRLLEKYSETMKDEMERLNENALQNLSLQEQYSKSVKTEVFNSVYSIYHQVEEQEKQAINKLMQYVEANSDQMEKDITACTENLTNATTAANKASKRIGRSVERFRKITTFKDLLYYSAPVLVLIDIILRVVALVAHRG